MARPIDSGSGCAGNAGSRCMVAFHADETSRQKRPKAETAAAETMPGTTAVTTMETTTTTVTTYVTIVTTMDDGAEPIEIVSGILWDHKRAINLFNGYAEQTEAYAEILNQYQKDLGTMCSAIRF